jgi:thioredoxin 1
MGKILTDENFDKEINITGPGGHPLVLVDFFATWCEPCSVLAPILERLAEYFKGKIVFMKANLDNVPITAQKFSVEKIPTVVLFKNGKSISGFVGLTPEPAIKEWLENILKENT